MPAYDREAQSEGGRRGDEHLVRRPANFAPLTPLTFLTRAASGFANHVAVIAGERRFTYAEFETRCRRLASALSRHGVDCGDTVAVLAPNVPALLEAHYAVPMLGAVLNAINTRLDARTVGYILDHGRAKVFIVDKELGELGRAALSHAKSRPLVVHADDPDCAKGALIGTLDYEALIAAGDPTFTPAAIRDEWDAIALNYTSGTTGDPKGVVYHHRGAYLNALSNLAIFRLSPQLVYLWTLPMFHCNGWSQTWSVTALAGTHVCLRRLDPAKVFELIDRHGVTHASGAPVVLNMLLQAAALATRRSTHIVQFTVGGAAPAAALLEKMEQLNFRITHGYGLTKSYGPSVVCEWKSEWDELPLPDRALHMARQGIQTYGVNEVTVADPQTLAPVAADGATIGEILLRGATVMKGYHRDPPATEAAFADGWLHTGDLAVRHSDGYIEVKDRSKDIIISGGENISSLEIESVLYRHPAVLEVAIVARPDPKWGEAPCAFVALRPDVAATKSELIDFCRKSLAQFKVPKTVVFGPLPKTSTGKIQKHLLRERAKAIPS